VTADSAPETDQPDPARRDNGLLADSYVPLTDVAASIGPTLLVALGRARIAAYLVEPPAAVPAVSTVESDTAPEPREAPDPGAADPDPTRRLYVAADERADARTIVAAVIRSAGAEPPPAAAAAPRPDPLAGIDADAAFAALVADWHVDTHLAIREAEKSLSREDEDWRARLRQNPPPADPVWLDDEHYVPPVPPPLPRFAAPTIVAMAVLAVSIMLLGLGGEFGLASRLTLILGVGGVLLAAAMLIMRLRATPDEDDDGAIL
jgi:hypothetical protein